MQPWRPEAANSSGTNAGAPVVLDMRIALAAPVLWLFLAGADDCQEPKPDLAVTAFSVDSNGFLQVEISNLGVVAVPEPITGAIDIAIDGAWTQSVSFASLPAAERGFLLGAMEGTRGTIRTNVRLGGGRRDVSVVVDPFRQIAEENELNNIGSRALDAPAQLGPDFAISDLAMNGSNVAVIIANRGNQASPAGRVVDVYVNVDGLQSARAVTLPALSPQFTYTAVITPPAAVTGSKRVSVRLYTRAALDELDATNNFRIEHLPNFADLSAFDALIADPAINRALVWQDVYGTYPYASWPASLRIELQLALAELLEARPWEHPSPPPLDVNNTMTTTAARRVYIAHVAQSLWLEGTGRVSWSMRSLTDEGRAILLDSRHIVPLAAGGRHVFAEHVAFPRPFHVYGFLQSSGVIRASQLETVEAVIDWMRTHMRHGNTGDGDGLSTYGYQGPALVERMLWPLPGKDHISLGGCWTATGFLRATLRVLNIPVAARTTAFDGLHHSSPDFISIGRRMPHGDDVYTSYLTPSGGVLPLMGREILYTSGPFHSLFVAPTSLDCNGSVCNTPGQQIGMNHIRESLRKSHAWRLDFLVAERAYRGAAGVDAVLATQNSSSTTYALPAFSPSERVTMINELDTYILDALGGGDFSRGLERVRFRQSRFHAAKRVR